jgi:excisionase family DNA binding protein
MTLPEAARALGCTDSNLRHAIKRGSLRATKIGRDWLVSSEEVTRYQREVKRRTDA